MRRCRGSCGVRNRGDTAAQVTVQAHDDTDWEYEPLTLTVAAGAVAPFNSNDLEQGQRGQGPEWQHGSGRRGLAPHAVERVGHRGAGVHPHDGRLSDGDARCSAGEWPAAPRGDLQPREQRPSGELAAHVVNAGQEAAAVTITGIDDSGASPGSAVQVSVPAGSGAGLHGGGAGVWRRRAGRRAGRWRGQVASGGRL